MIIRAAIKSKVDGEIRSMPRPNRHHDIIRLMVRQGLPTPIQGEQGFIDNALGFINRRVAWMIVQDEKQELIERPGQGGQLYSEDLW